MKYYVPCVSFTGRGHNIDVITGGDSGTCQECNGEGIDSVSKEEREIFRQLFDKEKFN